MTDRFLGRYTSFRVLIIAFAFHSFFHWSVTPFEHVRSHKFDEWFHSAMRVPSPLPDFPAMFFYFYDGTIKIQFYIYDLSWVGQSSTSLLKQGRYVTLGGRGDAWGILSIYWNINFDPWSTLEIFGSTWPLINKRIFWTDLCRSDFSTSASSQWPTARGRFLLSTFFSRNRFHVCYVLAIILSLSTSVDVHYNLKSYH